ncbi:hypothetical protein J437_LFUL007278 [Ladona fulva]|uniref:Mos1 transposase HTH domain-containing protein n=1 Tax=Ladona fulva TaxID=123851 RepID=A0A8K0K2F3_LADFU|nr:hypothetical protein J437_LFUL007278 [Ladona fulva]
MSQSVSGSQCKMAGVLNDCTREEQRAVVRFLWAKGLSTEEVHQEMCPMYGDNCLSRKAVYNWIQMLNKGRENIRDRERPGRPAEVSTEATVQQVEQIIRNDRRANHAGVKGKLPEGVGGVGEGGEADSTKMLKDKEEKEGDDDDDEEEEKEEEEVLNEDDDEEDGIL